MDILREMEIKPLLEGWPLTTIIVALLATWTIYSISIIIYRLTLHPLAKFPGPKIAACTQLYEFYHDVLRSGQYQFLINNLHDQYGPIIRISPYELHISSPDFYSQLYTSASNPRDKWKFSADMVGTPSSFFASVEHHVHRGRRMPLNKFFSKKSVYELEGRISGHVEKLCKRIEEFRGTGKPLSLRYAFAALTIDVVSEYAFAKSYGALDDLDFAPYWMDAVDSILEGCYINQFFPWLPALMKNLPLWVVEKLNPHITTVIKYQKDLSEQIQTIMDNPEQDKETDNLTIFHEFLTSPDLPLADRNLTHFTEEAQNLIGAGQTTTAHHLNTTMFHILDNADVLARLKGELETAMPDPRILPPLHELENLEYLSAVITEGHRLSPGNIHRLARISHDPIPTPFPTPTAPTHLIPPNTPISMSILTQHHTPSLFPSPKTFSPARFLSPPSQDLKRYVVPYSKGTRNCIGQNLAQAEIYMALAAVVRRFEVEVWETERGRDIDVVFDFITPKASRESRGLRVLVK
ncbi:hypothetical protein M409DRAFT_66571 [Zasmidium cellare ATCC 36951]|uniref:Cytochrome P450 n=1 Tax=Zasmidium cellare ATCC 36951 TaxID=1080233 RepID=A0A6A6CHB1_ZASCE|nr:uncharacterized protein M409DRAFT_66571 [Zasmidium cellare ATCC 36951]KAF2166545.1 hypothetical protein M409DRAFT_66571 [Zasmidium cellare ATCC 36951]